MCIFLTNFFFIYSLLKKKEKKKKGLLRSQDGSEGVLGVWKQAAAIVLWRIHT